MPEILVHHFFVWFLVNRSEREKITRREKVYLGLVRLINRKFCIYT